MSDEKYQYPWEELFVETYKESCKKYPNLNISMFRPTGHIYYADNKSHCILLKINTKKEMVWRYKEKMYGIETEYLKDALDKVPEIFAPLLQDYGFTLPAKTEQVEHEIER